MKKTMLILAALAVLAGGCGYRLSSPGSSTGPAAGAYKVSVPLFANDTFEPLVERELTAALKDEISLDGRWVLTDPEDADLEVAGKVTRVELIPLTYDARERIQEYRIRINSEVRLLNKNTGELLWKDDKMDSFSEFRVTQDVTKSKINRNEAIRKASRDFAEEFIIRVLDTF